SRCSRASARRRSNTPRPLRDGAPLSGFRFAPAWSDRNGPTGAKRNPDKIPIPQERPMTPSALLRDFESLSHDARMRRMVEIGRRSVRDATLLATLAALARGDFGERLLALQSC